MRSAETRAEGLGVRGEESAGLADDLGEEGAGEGDFDEDAEGEGAFALLPEVPPLDPLDPPELEPLPAL